MTSRTFLLNLTPEFLTHTKKGSQIYHIQIAKLTNNVKNGDINDSLVVTTVENDVQCQFYYFNIQNSKPKTSGIGVSALDPRVSSNFVNSLADLEAVPEVLQQSPLFAC